MRHRADDLNTPKTHLQHYLHMIPLSPHVSLQSKYWKQKFKSCQLDLLFQVAFFISDFENMFLNFQRKKNTNQL